MVENCERVWSEVSNYLENDLDPALRAAMDEHLQGCPHCRSVVDGTRNIIQLYGDERLFQMPLGFSARLRRKLAFNRPQRQFSGYGWLAAVAALGLIAGSLSLAASSASSHAVRLSQMAQPAHLIPADMMVVVAEHGKLFHIAGCTFIHAVDGNVRTMTAREAIHQGYAPCVRCLGEYVLQVAREFARKHGMAV